MCECMTCYEKLITKIIICINVSVGKLLIQISVAPWQKERPWIKGFHVTQCCTPICRLWRGVLCLVCCCCIWLFVVNISRWFMTVCYYPLPSVQLAPLSVVYRVLFLKGGGTRRVSDFSRLYTLSLSIFVCVWLDHASLLYLSPKIICVAFTGF